MDETVAAKQMIGRHGRDAVLRARETATALHAMGDEDGAARWRRIRDLIRDIFETTRDEPAAAETDASSQTD